MENVVIFQLIIASCLIAKAVAGDTCTMDNGARTKYCSHGCCGEVPNETCCGIAPWIIVLIVLAGIVLVGVIVGIICCCFMSKRFRMKVSTQSMTPKRNANDASPSIAAATYRRGSIKAFDTGRRLCVVSPNEYSYTGRRLCVVSPNEYSSPRTRPFFFGGKQSVQYDRSTKELPPLRAPRQQDSSHQHRHHLHPESQQHVDSHHLHLPQEQRRGSLLLHLQEQQNQSRRGSLQHQDQLNDHRRGSVDTQDQHHHQRRGSTKNEHHVTFSDKD